MSNELPPNPDAGRPVIYYEVDPSTNPDTWPGQIPPPGSHTAIFKVDVMFININAASDFTMIRTGTDEPIEQALFQVTKHVARGLYRIISLQISQHSCVVVMSALKQRDELVWKNGFPWDREKDPQPEVVLR